MPEWKELIRRRLVELNLAPEREAEIAEELAQHAEDRYEELKLSGVSDSEALRLTLNEVLDEKAMASGLRDVERTGVPDALVLGARAKEGHFLNGLGQDLRYGIRTLRKNAGFSAIAILTLGIGIGACTAIFSVVNGVLLRPLAYPDSSQLLNLYEKGADFSYGSVAYPNYLDWRGESHSFSGMGAYTSAGLQPHWFRAARTGFRRIRHGESVSGIRLDAAARAALSPRRGQASAPDARSC